MSELEAIKFIEELPPLQDIDIKIGLTTRYVCKVDYNRFELTDTTDGWLLAKVNRETLINVLIGKKSLTELNWK